MAELRARRDARAAASSLQTVASDFDEAVEQGDRQHNSRRSSTNGGLSVVGKEPQEKACNSQQHVHLCAEQSQATDPCLRDSPTSVGTQVVGLQSGDELVNEIPLENSAKDLHSHVCAPVPNEAVPSEVDVRRARMAELRARRDARAAASSLQTVASDFDEAVEQGERGNNSTRSSTNGGVDAIQTATCDSDEVMPNALARDRARSFALLPDHPSCGGGHDGAGTELGGTSDDPATPTAPVIDGTEVCRDSLEHESGNTFDALEDSDLEDVPTKKVVHLKSVEETLQKAPETVFKLEQEAQNTAFLRITHAAPREVVQELTERWRQSETRGDVDCSDATFKELQAKWRRMRGTRPEEVLAPLVRFELPSMDINPRAELKTFSTAGTWAKRDQASLVEKPQSSVVKLPPVSSQPQPLPSVSNRNDENCVHQ